jgi:hypothetical protein
MGLTGRSFRVCQRRDADCLDEGRERAARAIQGGEIDLTLRFTLQGFMEWLDQVGFFEKLLQPVKVGQGQGVANGLHKQCTRFENLLTIPMWDPFLSEFAVNVSDQGARFCETGYHVLPRRG